MTRGTGITKLYQNCPVEMLAFRIAPIFTEIKSEADMVRHNDALAEVKEIINSSHPEKGKFTAVEGRFIDKAAELILYPAKNDFRKKRFIFRLAGEIRQLGSMKGK